MIETSLSFESIKYDIVDAFYSNINQAIDMIIDLYKVSAPFMKVNRIGGIGSV